MTAPLTIVIPMAGNGQRFRDAGYTVPKPLIPVHGKPMIEHVIGNIGVPGAKLVLIARSDDAKTHPGLFAQVAERNAAEFIWLDHLTEGAACTVLHAKASIAPDAPLLLANSDQLVDWDAGAFLAEASSRRLDGLILTFHEAEKHPKWSYAAIGADGLVTQTKEKEPISSHATVGIYWFAKGRYFTEAAEEMIAKNDRSKNEFYVCPAYNYMIARKLKIGISEITKERMHGLGTPEDLTAYLATHP